MQQQRLGEHYENQLGSIEIFVVLETVLAPSNVGHEPRRGIPDHERHIAADKHDTYPNKPSTESIPAYSAT